MELLEERRAVLGQTNNEAVRDRLPHATPVQVKEAMFKMLKTVEDA